MDRYPNEPNAPDRTPTGLRRVRLDPDQRARACAVEPGSFWPSEPHVIAEPTPRLYSLEERLQTEVYAHHLGNELTRTMYGDGRTMCWRMAGQVGVKTARTLELARKHLAEAHQRRTDARRPDPVLLPHLFMHKARRVSLAALKAAFPPQERQRL